MAHHVTVIPGDGVGPEVVGAAQAVLEATGVPLEWDVRQMGEAAAPDDPLPSATMESIRRNGVALKGPLATGTAGRRSPNVALRRSLDLYVQLRPARSVGRPSTPLKPVDVVVVRETTEDLYRGIEVAAGSDEARELSEWLASRGLETELGADTGFSLKPTTERAVRRAAAFTLQWMRQNGRRRLTVVHKATVMRATDGVFLDVVRDLGSTITDIQIDSCQIDAACALMITDPTRFDVLLMPNMYGDIMSDITAALTGGVGLAPGANHGDGVAVFEAVHGTAPSHAGRDDVNPLGLVRSGALLLAHLGEVEAAREIEVAVADLLRERRCVTYDVLGTHAGAARTSEVAAELVDRLSP